MKRTLILVTVPLLGGTLLGLAFGAFWWNGAARNTNTEVIEHSSDGSQSRKDLTQVTENENDDGSRLVGTWAFSTGGSSDIPSNVSIVTITNEGFYHWLDYRMDYKAFQESEEAESRDGRLIKGSDIRYYTGEIELATGREKVSLSELTESFRGLIWEIRDGRLFWKMDMGIVGGQGVYFWRIDY